jgi:hypothetical protein
MPCRVVNGWVRVAVALEVFVTVAARLGRGPRWPGAGRRGGMGKLSAASGRAGPGWFRLGWRGGGGRPAGWPGGGRPGGGAHVSGCAQRGVGLGGTLLGLAPLRDGFSQRDEADQQHDRGERPVPSQVGVGGDEPGGVTELIPRRCRGGHPPHGWRAARSNESAVWRRARLPSAAAAVCIASEAAHAASAAASGAGVRGLILGACLLGGSLFMLFSALHRDATGSFPRPPARVRLRRSVAEIQRKLEAEAPLSRTDAVPLRTQLTRMGLLGNRLTNRASASRWPDAIRQENRWLVTLVSVAVTVPIATAMTLLTIDITDDADWVKALRQVLILLGLSAITLTGAELRRRRHRYDLHEFGRELSSESTRLLVRLAEVTTLRQPGWASRSRLRPIRWRFRSSVASS